jgi:hypothetical protein
MGEGFWKRTQIRDVRLFSSLFFSSALAFSSGSTSDFLQHKTSRPQPRVQERDRPGYRTVQTHVDPIDIHFYL